MGKNDDNTENYEPFVCLRWSSHNKALSCPTDIRNIWPLPLKGEIVPPVP